MPTWNLIVVVKDREYTVAVGKDESVALRALDEARKHIGFNGTVTIFDRLALKAQDIVAVRIEEIAA